MAVKSARTWECQLVHTLERPRWTLLRAEMHQRAGDPTRRHSKRRV